MTTSASVREIILKWYRFLSFSPAYDAAFYAALDTVYVDADANAEHYDQREKDGIKNFLHYLYFCEAMECAYAERGIDRAIFLDTLHELVRWTDTWSDLKGELYLGEIDWLWHIFTLRIIKLGRLEYNRAAAREDAPAYGIKKGDPVLDIHIPPDGPLSYEACLASLAMARKFYAKYYPEFEYKCFVCHSWLLDTSIDDILKPGGNILRFHELFDIVALSPSDAILVFTLRWNVTREEIADIPPSSAFARVVKEEALSGRTFYVGYGVIPK